MPLFCASVLGFTRNFETCSAVSFEWVKIRRVIRTFAILTVAVVALIGLKSTLTLCNEGVLFLRQSPL